MHRATEKQQNALLAIKSQTTETLSRVRADIIGHARINMSVNISHAWFKMAD